MLKLCLHLYFAMEKHVFGLMFMLSVCLYYNRVLRDVQTAAP